jgi:hypothetical protein
MGPNRKDQVVAESNVYTALLALALVLTLATVGLVVFKCYYQYETIFKVAG